MNAKPIGMKQQISIVIGIASILILVIVGSGYTLEKKSSEVIFPVNQYVTAPPVPEAISFADEFAPLRKYYVHEALKRELVVNTYFHSSTVELLKLSKRYMPIIEHILQEQGVPDDFKFLAMAESGLRNVKSPAGAEGIWQIMKGTAKDFGLELRNDVDERYELEKATRVACMYLKKAHKKFGSWTMAAAAYNAGNTSIARQVKRQGQESYYDLYLTTETGRYVYRILAIKEIYNNPEKYGFYLEEKDYYPEIPFVMVEVSKADSIKHLAKEHGTTYKEIKLLNPWLQSFKLEPNQKGKKYQVKIPKYSTN